MLGETGRALCSLGLFGDLKRDPQEQLVFSPLCGGPGRGGLTAFVRGFGTAVPFLGR